MSTHIVLVEFYYAPIHGDPCLEGHYLVIGKFRPFTYTLEDPNDEDPNDEEDEDLSTLADIATFYRANYNRMLNVSLPPHSIIRNYPSFIRSNNYFTPQIAKCIVLPTQETIAIIKTMWIKIIQRTWKKVYNNRKQILYTLINQNKFQLHGNIMNKLPNIKGMLYNISCKKK